MGLGAQPGIPASVLAAGGRNPKLWHMPQSQRPLLPIIGSLLLFIVAGCSTSARRLDVAPVRQIVPGTTTVKEVEGIFGPAPVKLTGANGKTVARYFHRTVFRSEEASRYERYWRPAELRVRTLSVLYGPNGIVEKKLHDESVTPVHRSREWLESGPMLRPDEPAYIKRQLTSADDLIKRYGEPTSRALDTEGRTCLMWLYLKDRTDRLGQPVGRMLLAVLDEQNMVLDHTMLEENPRVWLFGPGVRIRPQP